MNILITGADGFIGKNLQVNLALRADLKLLLFDLPQTSEDLEGLVHQADLVFHLAGINRPKDPEEYKTGNADLTQYLLHLLEQEGRKTPVVMSSSIQAELDNPYGRSKKEAEGYVFAYAIKNSAPVYVYRFPNVFGKWCKPNYNSVVATYCYNAANQIPLRIDDPDRELTLLYIDDIITEFQRIIDGKAKPAERSILSIFPTYNITLGGLADTISRFAASRSSLIHDKDRNDPLIPKLYATFLSYLPPGDLAIGAEMKRDDRGFFAELIKSPFFGQISVSRTKPGVTRGNHWHNTKVEKFIVIQGEAIVRFRKIDSEEIFEYLVSGEDIKIIDIPPGYTHNIQNIGESDVLTIFWAGEAFDPDNPDTVYAEV